MSKSARRTANDAVATAADGAPKAAIGTGTHVNERDIARRAYDLYLARGCEPGHQIEDWLEAERELRQGSLTRSE